LHRKRLHHLVKRPLFLPGVPLDCEVCSRTLRRFMILYRLSLVEQAQLVFAQDIPPLLAGLPELRTLGIGEDLCHVLQLSLQLFHLSSQRRVFFLQPGDFRLQKGDIRTVIIPVFRHANVTLFIAFLLKLYHKSAEKYRKYCDIQNKSLGGSFRIAVRCSMDNPSISHRKVCGSSSRSSASLL